MTTPATCVLHPQGCYAYFHPSGQVENLEPLADAQAAQEYLDATHVHDGCGLDCQRGPSGPVAEAVTPRLRAVLEAARVALTQAQYEAHHTNRQDPAPVHGSPWTTPDAPAEVRLGISKALAALERVL